MRVFSICKSVIENPTEMCAFVAGNSKLQRGNSQN